MLQVVEMYILDNLVFGFKPHIPSVVNKNIFLKYFSIKIVKIYAYIWRKYKLNKLIVCKQFNKYPSVKRCHILNIKFKFLIKREGKNDCKVTLKSQRKILSHGRQSTSTAHVSLMFLVPQISNALVQQPPQTESGRSGYNSEPEGSPVSWILDNPTVKVCGRKGKTI
jgi:hypothetical protein